MSSRLACVGLVVALVTGTVVDSLAQDFEAADAEDVAPTADAAPPVVHSAPPSAPAPDAAPAPQAAPTRVPVPAQPAPGAPSPAVTSGAEPKVLGRRFPSPLQVQPEREAPDVSVSIVSPSESGVRRRGRQGRDGGAESLTGDAEGEGGGTQVERLE